jgi:hypothetical protein
LLNNLNLGCVLANSSIASITPGTIDLNDLPDVVTCQTYDGLSFKNDSATFIMKNGFFSLSNLLEYTILFSRGPSALYAGYFAKVNSLLTEILCANGSCPIF